MANFNSPFFSVIIPSYNSGKFIFQSIQSVLDQKFSNWEILVIDNYSTDGTDEFLNTFDNQRIRIFKINNYGSISKSRNYGIKKARGEWIAFLDADDWWEPNKLFLCEKNIKDGVDFIYHDLFVISQNKKFKDIHGRQLKSPVIFDLLLNGNPIATSSVVVKKSVLEEIGYMNENPGLIKTADYNAWLKIASITNSFLHIPKKLGYYRMHDKNISDNVIIQPTLDAMEEFSYFLTENQKNKIINNLIYSQARFSYLNKNHQQLVLDLIQVIKHGSLSRRVKSIIMLIGFYIHK